MTDLRQAAQQALEALEDLGMKHHENTGETLHADVYTALRTALEQQQAEPVAVVDDEGVIIVCSYKYKPGDKLYTTPPAAQPAPAPMSQPNRLIAYAASSKLRELGYEWVDDTWKQALAAPAAQRPWQGLTDEEIREVITKVSQIPPIDFTATTYARAIEAKLKERNT